MDSNPGALYTALAKAQAEMSNVIKDSANPHFRSKFASLAAVRDVVIPALSAQGISIVQMPGNTEDGRVSIRTMLLHESGTLDCGTVATTVTVRGGNEAQALGSALTYLRRYALSAIAGVAQEDDETHMFGDLSEEANRAEAEGMVRETTGFSIEDMMGSKTAREAVISALRENARRGR
jgi:hypothetical protein